MENAQLLEIAVKTGKISQFFGKYRTIDQTKYFLNSSELYFSNHEKFNDPFEFSSILEYSCTPEEECTFFKKIGTPNSCLNYAISNEEYFIKNAINEVNKQMGVLCGTIKDDNLLMWAHYADSHKGTFLLFDILQDPNVFFYPKKVIYNNDSVNLNYIKEQLGDKKNLIKPLFHKSKVWEYEEEIRVVDMITSRAKQVKKEALIKIVFGCKASTSDIDYIKRMCENTNFKNVSFYKAEMNKQKYELDIVQL